MLSLAACGKQPANEAEVVVPNESAVLANATNAAINATAPAAAVDVSNWAALDAAVGKYPADLNLWENSVLVAPMKALLKDDYDDFVERVQVSGPLGKEGGVLFVSGNKPHEGGSDAAYMLADPATQRLEVGIWDDGKLKAYNSPGALLTRPKDVRTMISNMRAQPKTS
ncbi:hypothetical protein D3876_04125 [Sphingomonas cavernae]|uniref:Uncharacterized protein n=1 Tax=Sphingomonas cavernae TaxID=2320861 RepID=A0A418WQN9_9SPHN|nr:hypothetical protein D3876_04125 [Sphingomonas cavernae]